MGHDNWKSIIGIKMDYSRIFSEIDNLFSSEKLFTPSFELTNRKDLLITHNLEEAVEMARFQMHDYTKYKLPKDQLIWRDLCSSMEGVLTDIVYDKDESWFSQSSESTSLLLEKINDRLTDRGFFDLVDEVLYDADVIALSKAFFKKPESVFFEFLFEIYKFGGWPCGWRGEYPEGKLCVYIPPANGICSLDV